MHGSLGSIETMAVDFELVALGHTTEDGRVVEHDTVALGPCSLMEKQGRRHPGKTSSDDGTIVDLTGIRDLRRNLIVRAVTHRVSIVYNLLAVARGELVVALARVPGPGFGRRRRCLRKKFEGRRGHGQSG